MNLMSYLEGVISALIVDDRAMALMLVRQLTSNELATFYGRIDQTRDVVAEVANERHQAVLYGR